GLGEDLQEVALVVAVYEDAQVFELVEVFVYLADAEGNFLVVGVGHAQELQAVIAQLADRAQDVAGDEGDVLDAGAEVEVEVLLYLRLLAPFGRLIDGELDAARAVLHHLGHEGRVLGGDVLVVERDELGETHDAGVVIDPLVHFAKLHVEHLVVYGFDAGGGARHVALLVAGHESARVVVAVDEGVNGISAGGYRGLAYAPLLALDVHGFQ